MLNNKLLSNGISIPFDINHSNVVVLTGAGISAESGLKTFRDNDGLWENHRVEDVATPEAFRANPSLVYRFYNLRRQQLFSSSVKANAAHIALAKLESVLKDRLTIVTQNVDNLHEKAGNLNVMHMHGELSSIKCVSTNKSVYTEQDIDQNTRCDCCETPQAMRPDIVWFGEIPYYMDKIESLLFEANVFISIGTSGNVYPAAGFVNFASSIGAFCVELNLEPSSGSSAFDLALHGKASELVPQFVDHLLRIGEDT